MKLAVQIPILLSLFAGSVHSADPAFAVILGGSGQDYATSVTSDAQGNVYVVGLTYSPDFPVTPGAAQTRFGGTSDAFVAKLGPDGKRIWATYLGGILDDWATGVALDSAGNVLVTGNTRSGNFPLVNPVKSTLNGINADDYDAFVAKLDPSGTRLLFSTFLGGNGEDAAGGIATDAAGNAYVAVTVQSAAGFPGTRNAPNQFGIVVSKVDPQGAVVYSYFHPYGTAGGIALDAAGSAYVGGTMGSTLPSSATHSFGPAGTAQALVFKITPDGNQKVFETTLGGSVRADASAIAVNSAGEVYVAGTTSSVDFPLVRPLQSTPGARPLWKSTDSGATWAPIDDLPFALPKVYVVDPSTSNTLYCATGDLGVFKSVDGGVTWKRANSGIAATKIDALAIDPLHPQTLYASTFPYAVYKTIDGANSWTLIDSPPISNPIYQLAVDGQNSNIVWQIGNNLRKSTDAGVTWNPVAFPGTVQFLALDPRVSGRIFAISNFLFCGFFCNNNQSPHFYRSQDGGATWVQDLSQATNTLVVDPSTNPSTVYDGLGSRSLDGGVTFSRIAPPPGADSGSGSLAVDSSGTLYAITAQGIFVSRNHAETWTAVSSFSPPWPAEGSAPPVFSIVPAGSAGTLLGAISQSGMTSGFVTRLSADGAGIMYSTYLRGHPAFAPSLIFSAEPGAFLTQNWISAIALDAAGNVTVAGGTRASDFPVATPARAANTGRADAFVATFSADGSKLNYATYFGGSQDDGALAASLDNQGNVILAGQTWSGDFPIPGGVQPPTGFGEAFVVKLAPPGPPEITSVLNGASLLPGIEAGSWVTIRGANLANTNPGRTWRDEEVVNGNLPTSLDGVGVTIDGKPAFVYYISPTQINVQAPSDSAVGPVNVLVTNNGVTSAPATAQLQAVAPAFFTNPGTNFVIASRLPDYKLVADPSVVTDAVAAKPGDLVVLWGTGFGATSPPAPAGVTVAGAPAVVTAPTVTVGGVPAPVISTVLTNGTAGLYQVTIQLPAALPASGAMAVRASVAGVQTQDGALLFVRTP